MSLDHQQAAFVRQQAAHAGPSSLASRPVPPGYPPGAMTGLGQVAVPLPSAIASLPAHQQALLMRQQQQRLPALTAPTDGGPPYKVPLYPALTRVQPMEPGQPFPSVTEDDQKRVRRWIDRDVSYEAELSAARRGKRQEQMQIQQEVHTREDWLGGVDRPPPQRMKIRFDDHRVRRGLNRMPIKMSKQQLREMAHRGESIVPIRLECEHEVYKLRDTFTWNVKETMVTPEIFASHLCDDMRLPFNGFYKEIVTQIKRHIEDAQLNENYIGHLADNLASVREDNRQWFEKRRLVDGANGQASAEGEDELPLPAGELHSREEGAHDELRVLIRLDITLDTIQLVDKFEWDISNPQNSPEEFAEIFSADLGLSGEFKTAIAHSIREQIDLYTRSLCILGYAPGASIPDEDLRREFLPPLHEPFRADADDFTPLLNHLTAEELDRNEKEREREARRKRRQTKGRGVTLPDRDFNRTHRSLVPKPDNAPLQSYLDARGETVYPMAALAQPYPITLPPPGEKPVDIETVAASPLKLIPAKGSAAALAATAASIPSGDLKPGVIGRKRKLNADGSVDLTGDADGAKRGPKGRRGGPNKPNLAALGLHEHMVDGKWHCANCGVPEEAAVGRRKGPSGANSLCGQCGKYFHRWRKNRPCEYTTDLETHRRMKADADAAKAAAKAAEGGDVSRPSTRATESDGDQGHRSGSARPKRTIPDTSDEDSDESETSATPRRRRVRGQSPDLPFVQIGTPDSDDSSTSSEEGASQPPRVAPAPPAAPVPARSSPTPLPWMIKAAAELRAKQVDDRFEIIPRPRPPDPNVQEWRIRCLDCPGKLYNLGPDETLTGFQVHFKNKQHRANVDARLKAAGVKP